MKKNGTDREKQDEDMLKPISSKLGLKPENVSGEFEQKTLSDREKQIADHTNVTRKREGLHKDHITINIVPMNWSV